MNTNTLPADDKQQPVTTGPFAMQCFNMQYILLSTLSYLTTDSAKELYQSIQKGAITRGPWVPLILTFRSLYQLAYPAEHPSRRCKIKSTMSDFAASLTQIQWVFRYYHSDELISFDKKGRLDTQLLQYAAGNGQKEALQWLRSMEPPCPWDEDACALAARNGHLETLQWLRSQDPPCPWDEDACALTAANGHLETLRWLRSQKPPCPWDERACAYAAANGQLETLKWLRDQEPPCPWDTWASARAAANGHLEILKWLRSQEPPCPWDTWACVWAAERGQLETLQWLRSQQPPCPWNTSTCYNAAVTGELETLKWLRSQEPPCPWFETMCRQIAQANHHVDIIHWMDSLNTTVANHAMTLFSQPRNTNLARDPEQARYHGVTHMPG